MKSSGFDQRLVGFIQPEPGRFGSQFDVLTGQGEKITDILTRDIGD